MKNHLYKCRINYYLYLTKRYKFILIHQLGNAVVCSASIFFAMLSYAQQADSYHAINSHIDFGQSYGIYTINDGLLIEPRWNPYFLLHYEMDNIVADSQSGLGYKFINSKNINAGLSIAYQYGREESAESRYRGLGNVAATAAPSVFAELTAFSDALDIFVETGQSIGETHARYITIDTTVGLPLSSRVSLFFDFLTMGGDDHYTRTFYEVSSAQSERSGYSVYRPRGGLTTITPAVGVSYSVSRSWEIVSDIGVVDYIDAAEHSPLITHHQFTTGNIWLSYKF